MIIVNNQGNDRPGIRALVIGVGHYDSVRYYNLDDISSATVSALEFALWLQNRLRFPDPSSQNIRYLDVKYLDVLVSAANNMDSSVQDRYRNSLRQVNQSWNYEEVYFQKIRDAILQWQNECNRSENEVAFFYFCGHGVEHKGIKALLAQDFNAATHEFKKSLDLKTFYDATASFQATKKYFFIDSCRSTPSRIRNFRMISPDPVIYPELDLTHHGDAPLYYATKQSDSAWGENNQISQFTDAIIRALNGAGANLGRGNFQGKWIVKSTTLTEGISEVLEFEEKYNEALHQEPQRGEGSMTGTVLHVIENEPEIPAGFTWTETLNSISLKLVNNNSQETLNNQPKIIKAYPILFPIDSLQASVNIDGQDVVLHPDCIPLLPPRLDVRFQHLN
ncbi:MAG: caspase family protein [Xenococcaceae cyanobacterium]